MRLFIMIGCIFLFVPACFSAVVNVPGDQPNIQAGINAAQDSDTVLVAAGTYSGEGSRDVEFFGKAVVLKSAAGPEVTIIDAGQGAEAHRAFYIHNSEGPGTVIDGFTITNGCYEFSGGAIQIAQASPTIRNCRMINNYAHHGGAFYFTGDCTPVVENCLFEGNSCGDVGGAVLVRFGANALFQNCVFRNNEAKNGIFLCYNASPTVIDCQFIENTTTATGGAAFLQDNCSPIFSGCLFVGNHSKRGGAVWLEERMEVPGRCNPAFEHCVFVDNSASVYGGVFAILGPAFGSITNCTFYDNFSDSGSFISRPMVFEVLSDTGIYPFSPGMDSLAEITITYSIVAFNRGARLVINSAALSIACSDAFGNEEGDWVGDLAGVGGINGNFALDPRFCDTSSSDFSLDKLSPCLPANNGYGELIGAVGEVCGNTVPTISCGVNYFPVGDDEVVTKTDIEANDPDPHDQLTFSLVSSEPMFNYAPIVDATTGEVTFTTSWYDIGAHEVCIEVTDGYETDECCFTVEVIPYERTEIQIQKTHGTLQGHYVDVALTLNRGAEVFGGFDFLIGYDNSALTFTEAALGEYFVQCGWEYFSYRYSWNGNCGNACPTGVVRLIGIAETINGPNHPDWGCINAGMDGQVLATLTFLVSNDRTLQCQYVPIQFYWIDCGDNAISTIFGDSLMVSRKVYDFEHTDITDVDYGFPGWYGAPDVCLEGDKIPAVRWIEFINGGIDIVCGDSIDLRGDINVNGVAYEVADAVMYVNYFINGLSQWSFPVDHVEASIAASDVNADGVALSVADLVYLIRIIAGDANPYPKPNPGVQAEFTCRDGSVTGICPIDLGAALLIFRVNGEAGIPAARVDMDLKYARDDGELRVLIYDIGRRSIPAGENRLVTIPGDVELIGVEAASYDGFSIETSIKRLSDDFSLSNCPNPFNPSTIIWFNLPAETDWTVDIINVAGQVILQYSDHSPAGKVEVMWDGTDAVGKAAASGIYFYRVKAGQFSQTKKMVLIK